MRWPRLGYMPRRGGIGGRNLHSIEPFVTFMEASTHGVVGLIVNLDSRYDCVLTRAGPRFILNAFRATLCPKVATTKLKTVFTNRFLLWKLQMVRVFALLDTLPFKQLAGVKAGVCASRSQPCVSSALIAALCPEIRRIHILGSVLGPSSNAVKGKALLLFGTEPRLGRRED